MKKITNYLIKRRFNVIDWVIMVFVGHFIKNGEPLLLLGLVALWWSIDELADKITKRKD